MTPKGVEPVCAQLAACGGGMICSGTEAEASVPESSRIYVGLRMGEAGPIG
jgi:hypothetical protein